MTYTSAPTLPLENKGINIYNNSLNAIRVLAAFNVFFKHFVHHFSPSWSDILFVKIVSAIPNVPIFFGISGFLLYQSWLSNKAKGNSTNHFLITKFLRVLPAVWLSFFISITLLISLGVIGKNDILSLSFFGWVISQLSFFQVYNPNFLRDYGVGVLNGSLWTISVIFQYYLLFIILARLLSFFEEKGMSGRFIAFLLFSSLVCRLLISNLVGSTTIFEKILTVSVFNHLYFFVLGMTIRYYFKELVKFINYKTLVLLFLSLILIFFISIEYSYSFSIENNISIVKSTAISLTLFIFAYIFPNFLSLAKKYNISYGIFIWHMIFINLFVEYYSEANAVYIFIYCVILVLFFSYLQLRFIENKFYYYAYNKYFSKNRTALK